jgi:Tfp pilus assembly protein PilE
MKLHTRDDARGVTIIELLVMLVIVCFLGLFVALAYSGVQAKNRNVERQDDIDKLKSQLESYYAEANSYPTLANLNSPAWRAVHLPHVSQALITDPSWKSSTPGCTGGGHATAAGKPATDCYSYQVTGSDGNACDNVSVACAHYTITANLEGGEKYVKSSLN